MISFTHIRRFVLQSLIYEVKERALSLSSGKIRFIEIETLMEKYRL